MSARRPDEVKAAVMAALLSGQGVSEVAEAFNIPIPTVKSWIQRDRRKGDASAASVKKPEIGELVMAYLRETLETLRVQQVVFRNEKWLSKQPANELAVLHGVSCDKAIRLLEALQASGLANSEPSGDASA
ncbi:MAG: helix-turn-helix domain-containing protein [Thermoanaerobaculaceae bacterium]|nr:helix-turn-helix domain-containing protein [Thermoanaerobaculaceae bacterium]